MSLLQVSAMEHGRTVLTEAVRKVQLLKIDGYCATAAMERSEYIKFKWIVDGHEWEVRFYPNYSRLVAVKLILLRVKSTLGPPTIVEVWISTFNFKTG